MSILASRLRLYMGYSLDDKDIFTLHTFDPEPADEKNRTYTVKICEDSGLFQIAIDILRIKNKTLELLLTPPKE